MGDKKTIIIIGLVALLAFVGYFYYSSTGDTRELKAQIAELQAKVDSLEKANALLEEGGKQNKVSKRDMKKIAKELAGTYSCTPTYKVIGRTATSDLVLPNIECSEEGFVTIKVTIDETGSVASASVDSGNSTIRNSKVRSACREAAQKTKFTSGASSKAKGSITYTFSE